MPIGPTRSQVSAESLTITGLYNNGLHQTGRGGVAFASRWRPVVEARPAGEAGCSTGEMGAS